MNSFKRRMHFFLFAALFLLSGCNVDDSFEFSLSLQRPSGAQSQERLVFEREMTNTGEKLLLKSFPTEINDLECSVSPS